MEIKMNTFKTLDDYDFKGKRVLVRADFNVPVKDGKVTDTTRIDRFAPTAKELAEKGAKVIIISHFGRPKGQKNPEMSLRIVVDDLQKALGLPVTFIDDCIGEKVDAAVANMKDGEILLLENLRFYPEEESNDPTFALALTKNADIYVNDAFSVSHRAHTSVDGIARLLPNAAGHLMQEELEALNKALGNPERPLAAIVAGAKVSTKLDLLSNLITKVNVLVIGGGMANTFLYAKGVNVGASLCEKDMADNAKAILAKAKEIGCTIVLPTDFVVASGLEDGVNAATVEEVPEDKMILDIGPESTKAVIAALKDCRTVIWNGPLGAFEYTPFDKSTMEIAKEVAASVQAGKLICVAGGGDTVSALKKAGVEDKMTYVSSAGGAFLEWMEGKILPGVKALA
jgi:phosphoglycerate kinase